MKQIIMHYKKLYAAFCMWNSLHTAHNAVITVPIADLLGESIYTIRIPSTYTNIPLCGGTYNNLLACPRVHQALFNEMVTILKETETEYCVEITNAYYITEKSNSPRAQYWTLKKNCAVLDNKTPTALPIPDPINFKKQSSTTTKWTLTLTQPFHDHHTNILFSVGTRFVYLPEKSNTESYTIIYHNFSKDISVTCLVPKYICLLDDNIQEPHEKRTAMINLIRTWIGTQSNYYIPYVWGGCSYTHHYTGNFVEIQKKKGTTMYSYYVYPRHKKEKCHAGFDCSGLILKAAQCVGIPMFYKNSYTMQAKLKPITEYSALQPGDIVWIPGHVMIIADLNRNTLIEARGYTHGYGIVQETPICEQFKNLNSIEELMHQYKKNKPLFRLNKEGDVVKTVFSYKILRLF